MDDITILTRFVSSWGWHLIAIMFFSNFLILYGMRRPLWGFPMLGVFLVAEFMAYKRKLDVEQMNKGAENGTTE